MDRNPTGRCAACKYLRRRCPSDCIFSPYFPSNNHERFACVHRIYGASSVSKMLQQIPDHLRAEAADSLFFEAQCRIQDPVYGCVGIISLLHQQIHSVESQLAKTQVETMLLLNSNITTPQYYNPLLQNMGAEPHLETTSFLREQAAAELSRHLNVQGSSGFF